MNEPQSTPETTTSSTPAPEAKPASDAKKEFVSNKNATPPKKGNATVSILLVAVIAALGVTWWQTHQDMTKLRTEVAQQLHNEGTSTSEMKGVITTVQDSTKSLESKISVLENKQQESQSQQVALEQLYQELSKNRDDWVLSEVAEVLATANQQLELAGNVQGALIALDNVDKSLARMDKSQFTAVRRAIANDQAKLKAVPDIDVTGIAIRIDNALVQVDDLPLLLDLKTGEVINADKPLTTEAPVEPSDTSTWSKLKVSAGELAREAWSNLRDLIYVRRVDKPDALLLSPSQAYFIRENVKLRLLSARLALLSRNEFVFKNDLSTVQDIISKYFDPQDKQVQSVQATIKQVQQNNLSIQIPTLTESLNAVHSYNNAGR